MTFGNMNSNFAGQILGLGTKATSSAMHYHFPAKYFSRAVKAKVPANSTYSQDILPKSRNVECRGFVQGWRNDSRGGGSRPLGPRGKESPGESPPGLKRPKTTYTTIAIAEKQSKRSKKGPFSLYIGSPRVPPRKWNLWGPEGKVPPPPVSPAMVL